MLDKMWRKTPYGFSEHLATKARIVHSKGFPGRNFLLWVYPRQGRGKCIGCFSTLTNAQKAHDNIT